MDFPPRARKMEPYASFASGTSSSTSGCSVIHRPMSEHGTQGVRLRQQQSQQQFQLQPIGPPGPSRTTPDSSGPGAARTLYEATSNGQPSQATNGRLEGVMRALKIGLEPPRREYRLDQQNGFAEGSNRGLHRDGDRQEQPSTFVGSNRGRVDNRGGVGLPNFPQELRAMPPISRAPVTITNAPPVLTVANPRGLARDQGTSRDSGIWSTPNTNTLLPPEARSSPSLAYPSSSTSHSVFGPSSGYQASSGGPSGRRPLALLGGNQPSLQPSLSPSPSPIPPSQTYLRSAEAQNGLNGRNTFPFLSPAAYNNGQQFRAFEAGSSLFGNYGDGWRDGTRNGDGEPEMTYEQRRLSINNGSSQSLSSNQAGLHQSREVTLRLPEPWRPMEALQEERSGSLERARHLVESGMSLNYLGDPRLDNNQSADVPDSQNCSFWIVNLPPNVTHNQLLSEIRDMGRIRACVINGPQPELGHHTAAAKVVFFELRAAHRFHAHATRLGFFVRGQRARVHLNRIKSAEDPDTNNTRVLIIKGAAWFVNPRTLTNFFRARFKFEIDQVIVHLLTEEMGHIEYRFGSWRCQAQSARQSLHRDLQDGMGGTGPIWEVKFGHDPCAPAPVRSAPRHLALPPALSPNMLLQPWRADEGPHGHSYRQ